MTVALATVILLLAPAGRPASAAARAWLLWGDCPGGQAGYSRMFTCNTNDGLQRITIGMTATQDVTNVRVLYASLVVDGHPTSLPDWWRVDAGGCRAGAFQTSIAFSDPPYEDGLCLDAWRSDATLEATAHYDSLSDNLLILLTVRPVAPVSFQAGRSYALVELQISNGVTTGPSACSGCEAEVAVTLTDSGFDTFGSGWVGLGPAWLRWQGYGIAREPAKHSGAPADSSTGSPRPARR